MTCHEKVSEQLKIMKAYLCLSVSSLDKKLLAVLKSAIVCLNVFCTSLTVSTCLPLVALLFDFSMLP